jgi:two-component system response regulator MprA
VPDEPENPAVTDAGDPIGYIRYTRKRAPGHDRQEWGVFVKDRLNYASLWQASSIFSASSDSMTGMKAERAGQTLAPALRGERLLVVDDDPDVRDSLERALRCAGYAVTTAVHGADALDTQARSPVDLIVLDVLMPMVDGFDACRRLRARGDATPILVLTARDAVDDRVAGLAAGADDYLVKPFALRELLARVQALLRRSRTSRDVLGYADLTLDVTARKLTRGGRVIELTRTEFGLLELLLRNAEQVISYDVIRERVWGYGEAPASNALQVFVGFLRRKLEDGGGPRLLHNVRGVGYVIRTAP